MVKILCIAGTTASGKSARAIEEAFSRNGEIISVDSRQVYRGLDIGTEKSTHEEMCGVHHHLIDVRNVNESYSAGDFVADASRLIEDISTRGKLPILVGGTHFYFDALIHGLPRESPTDAYLRREIEHLPTEDLYSRVLALDPRRAQELDPLNRRRLIRALEIIHTHGHVPERARSESKYDVEWIIINPPMTELRERIDTRLKSAFGRGLTAEVGRIRALVGGQRLNELGLEYKIVGEFLQGERTEASLFPALSSKLWQYARHQKAWLRKLRDEHVIPATLSHRDRN